MAIPPAEFGREPSSVASVSLSFLPGVFRMVFLLSPRHHHYPLWFGEFLPMFVPINCGHLQGEFSNIILFAYTKIVDAKYLPLVLPFFLIGSCGNVDGATEMA